MRQQDNAAYKNDESQKKEILKVLKKAGIVILAVSAAVILFILFGVKKPFIAVGSFIAIAAAYCAAGILIGFLFGIPRSEKFRYKPNNALPDKSWYSENTNLEEISDWLTKIIVGLTLVQYREILKLLDQSSRSISSAIFSCGHGCQYYSFSYALIIFYMAAGFSIGYLWTRTRLPIILIYGKKEEETAINEKIADVVASAATKELVRTTPGVYDKSDIDRQGDQLVVSFSEKAAVLNQRPVKDKTDPQKNRWGGLKENNGKRIEGFVKASEEYAGFYDIRLRVSSVANNVALTGKVAFFVHDSFGFENDTIYADVTTQGFAEIPLVCYEAFTVGALCEDGTELELDLNIVKGFPEGFYWKE